MEGGCASGGDGRGSGGEAPHPPYMEILSIFGSDIFPYMGNRTEALHKLNRYDLLFSLQLGKYFSLGAFLLSEWHRKISA